MRTEPDAELSEWIFENFIRRYKDVDDWVAQAVLITQEEYDAIPLDSFSLIPWGMLGNIKVNENRKLIAMHRTTRCFHVSPNYKGEL